MQDLSWTTPDLVNLRSCLSSVKAEEDRDMSSRGSSLKRVSEKKGVFWGYLPETELQPVEIKSELIEVPLDVFRSDGAIGEAT